ncbi:MAG: hypothetical protein IJA80_02505 [Clostridia bacterium]|nr:hypothetical protein [Clostridia bacterium]
MASGDLVPRIYSNFRGVDFRGEDINIMRSPDSLNMWRDYKEVDSIRTRPEFKKVNLLLFEEDGKTVWGMNKAVKSSGQKSYYFHIGDKIYGCITAKEAIKQGVATNETFKDVEIEDSFIVIPLWIAPLDYSMNERKSSSFVFNDNVYTIDGKKYRKNLSEVKGYVPTTSIGRKPKGGGTVYEDVNMLSEYRINTFCGDGKNTKFFLDAQNIDDDFEPVVYIKQRGDVYFEPFNNSIESSKYEFHNKSNLAYEDAIRNKISSMANGTSITIQLYLEPGVEERDAIGKHIAGTKLISDDKLELYDFTGDGVIRATDARYVYKAISGEWSVSCWSGAVKSDVIVKKGLLGTITATGTNMWGREVTMDETELRSYLYKEVAVDYKQGVITFPHPIGEPATDGQDNIWILFKKKVEGVREKIEKCTMLEVFDNRAFFSGNPNYPNMIWHSSLENPEYVSDLDYYEEGLDSSPVTGMVAGNNALWVMKEPSPANTTIFYHTPTVDSEYGKIYPSTHSNIAIGCVGKAINFNDDIVFFSERGMEGIHGDVTTEQVLGHRSTLIDKKLLNEPNYKNMVLIEWEGYLFVFIDNKVYLADGRAKFTNENHIEYEWFYWEIDHIVTSAMVDDGILYIGTTDGIYKLTDTVSAVKSYWTTPKDKFKYPQYMKTTNKRGCVSEVTGDVSVYVKTDKTNDFEWINSYYNVTDKIVSRIKRKKFKDIQLKFESDTRFSLESATLECFIGGYIKR